MTNKHSLVLAGACLAFMLPAGASHAGALIEGTWLTPQQSEMTIAACVEGYCGYISRIVITDETRAKYGDEVDAVTRFTDYNNKDEALRDRPIEGLQILTLRQGADAFHFEGEIYNPEDGNTYMGFLEVKDENVMVLKGCAMMVLCQEQLWRRVSD
jgi:uncharacterized protein (DUF2147 family)